MSRREAPKVLERLLRGNNYLVEDPKVPLPKAVVIDNEEVIGVPKVAPDDCSETVSVQPKSC